jgi:hypothetical protein
MLQLLVLSKLNLVTNLGKEKWHVLLASKQRVPLLTGEWLM